MVRLEICIWDVSGFIVGRLPIILNKNFRGLPHSIPSKLPVSMSLVHDCFLPEPFQFIYHRCLKKHVLF